MDYVYNFSLDTFSKELPKLTLNQIGDKALSRARLKAPIKTGKLRRSIKYQVTESDVILYIDETMYTVPYYIYVNEMPGQSGRRKVSNGYWNQVKAEFGLVLYANLDNQFEIYQKQAVKEVEKARQELFKERDNAGRQNQIEAKARQEEEKTRQLALKREEERRKRNEENKQKTNILKVLAFIALMEKLTKKELKNGSKS